MINDGCTNSSMKSCKLRLVPRKQMMQRLSNLWHTTIRVFTSTSMSMSTPPFFRSFLPTYLWHTAIQSQRLPTSLRLPPSRLETTTFRKVPRSLPPKPRCYPTLHISHPHRLPSQNLQIVILPRLFLHRQTLIDHTR